MFFQGAGIHTNSDRYLPFSGSFNYSLNSVETSDISRIDSYLVSSGPDCRYGKAIVKMYVCHKRHAVAALHQFLLHPAQGICSLHIRYGDPHNLAACICKLLCLPEQSRLVTGIHICHGLYCDGHAAAYDDISDSYLFGFMIVLVFSLVFSQLILSTHHYSYYFYC